MIGLDSSVLASSVGSDLAHGRAQNSDGYNQPDIASINTIEMDLKQNRDALETVAKLDYSYNLDDSLNDAYQVAVNFANRTLVNDNLSMQFDPAEQKAIVTDLSSGDIVQEYNPMQVLQMYSGNYNLQGLVIDAFL